MYLMPLMHSSEQVRISKLISHFNEIPQKNNEYDENIQKYSSLVVEKWQKGTPILQIILLLQITHTSFSAKVMSVF